MAAFAYHSYMVQRCRLRIPGLLFLILITGAGALRSEGHKWKFLVFGDTLSYATNSPINTEMLAELVCAVTNENPAFVLVPGDLVFSGSEPVFQQWTNLMTPVYQAGIGVYPAVGNHDANDISAFANVFGPTVPANGPAGEIGSTYALGYSNALVLVLNQFVPGNEYRVNQAWIDAVLATNTRPHVFAAGHVPAFKDLHIDCLDNYPANRNLFWNSLSNVHARIYFCGHDHFYDHARLDDGDGNPDNDIHQFTAGTGGAPLYPGGAYDGTNSIWIPVRLFHEEQYGYVVVEIDDQLVTVSWHHRTAAYTYPAAGDSFTYSIPPRPVLVSNCANGKLVLTWFGGGTLQAGPALGGTFTNVPAATSPYEVPSLAQPSMFYRLASP